MSCMLMMLSLRHESEKSDTRTDLGGRFLREERLVHTLELDIVYNDEHCHSIVQT